jgi:hypothetical protein
MSSYFGANGGAHGQLISHDYTTAEGVNQAFETFISDKPETPIELIGYQVMAVKLSDENIEEQFSDSSV